MSHIPEEQNDKHNHPMVEEDDVEDNGADSCSAIRKRGCGGGNDNDNNNDGDEVACIPIGTVCQDDSNLGGPSCKGNFNRCVTTATTTSSCRDDSTNNKNSGNETTATTAAPCVPICYYYPNSPCPVPVETTPPSNCHDKIRKLLAEALGTGLLILVVVGSGIQAQRLYDDHSSPTRVDVAVQLWINAFATSAGLFCLITILGPVSGAHFNPCVSLVDALNRDMKWQYDLVGYVVAQTAGGTLGTILTHILFDLPLVTVSDTERWGYHLWISEIIATSTLIWVIHGCIRTGNESRVPTVVALWVGGGYFFTSSSIFANPAVTVARMWTNTFTGIEPASAVVYILFQIIGAILGWGLVKYFYPSPEAAPDQPFKENNDPFIVKQDDVLYQRACLLVNRDFFEKKTY